MKFDIDTVKRKMSRLRVDRNPHRYTVGKAPHKPVLLLSLMILDKNDRVDLTNIKPDLNLRETWGSLWGCLDYPKPGPIHLPMYHMKSDGFWIVELKKGVGPHQPRSVGTLVDMTDRIALKTEFIDLIEEDRTRNEIINSILNGGYFSDAEIRRLREFIKRANGSFRYEERLNQLVKEEFRMELDHVLVPRRDPAFRRAVLGAYDERCAVCEMRLMTASGISVVDAAHILPFSRFHNDDIRNGLSLCKLHHWLFDHGLLTVDNRYRVRVSNSIEDEQPKGAVTDIDRKELLLPEDAEKYPSHIALEWHRNEIYM